MSQYKIIFAGETLPGHDPDVVRERLAEALKVGPVARERLFSGRPLALKSGLDEAQAQSYRRKLAAMGVAVRIAPQLDAAAPAAAVAPVGAPKPAAAPASGTRLELVPEPTLDGQASEKTAQAPADDAMALVESVLSDRMVCPKCGHEQPKRTLCQACGTDMPRFAAAQAEAAAAASRDLPPHGGRAAAVSAGRQPAEPQDPSAPRDPYFHQEPIAERPKLLGLNFDGRMPRLSYFLGGIALVLVMAVVMAIASAMGPIVAGIAMLAVMIPSLRLSVLRLHDLNWAGWWCVLLFVPIVGNLLALVLLFMPGTQGSNDYGPETESHGWKPVLIALAIMVAGLGILVPISLGSYQAYVAKARAAEDRRYLANYNPAADEVFLFSVGDCAACDRLRGQFDRLGLAYTEFQVDRDPEMYRLLNDRVTSTGHRGAMNFPVVEVNGFPLPDNPSLPEISAYFGQRP